jgi:hypothetical protein
MKRYILFLIVSVTISNLCFSQQWMTSLDAAKRIALVQDKFLFVIWEDAALIPYPVIMTNEKGNEVVFENMFDHQEIDKIIWDYFVPVKVSEDLYGKLYDQIKDSRNRSYIAQFEDDNIKIMDVNGFILNRSISPEAYFNLSEFISRYALNTAFLKAELGNYAEHKDFNTAFRMAFKYMDYAILVDKKIRKDFINMANMYLENADKYLLESNVENKKDLTNKSSLLSLSQDLIQNRPGRVLRKLKKFEKSESEETNEGLLAFLYYTAYQLKNDKKNAEQWKSKVSSVNLRKAELITNLHL